MNMVPTNQYRARVFISALLLLLLGVTVYARSVARSHPIPYFDEVDYLRMAREFSQTSGLGIIISHLDGSYRNDWRNPLYIYLSSFFIDNTPADFARLKLLTLSNTLILILLIFFLCRRRWGYFVGLGSAAAVAFSPVAAELSHFVLADLLFIIFYFAAIMILLSDLLDPWKGTLFGVTAGLGYLTKANGHFLLLSLLAYGLCVYRGRFFRNSLFYYSLLFFFGTTSFLLVRNILVWHTPFYNFNNKVVWLDNWLQVIMAAEQPEWDQIGVVWYFKHHGLRDVFARILSGVPPVLKTFVSCLSVGWQNKNLMGVTGSAVLILTLVGNICLWKKGKKAEVLTPAAVNVPLLLAFVWAAGPVTPQYRYLFPVAVTMFPFALIGARCLISKWILPHWRGMVHGRALFQGMVCLSAVGFLAPSSHGLASNPLKKYYVPDFWRETSLWISANVDDKGFLKDNYNYYSMWDTGQDLDRPFPLLVPGDVVMRQIQKTGIRFVMIDRMRMANDLFKDKYGPADDHGPVTFLGWPRCFQTNDKPSTFLIYGAVCPPAL